MAAQHIGTRIVGRGLTSQTTRGALAATTRAQPLFCGRGRRGLSSQTSSDALAATTSSQPFVWSDIWSDGARPSLEVDGGTSIRRLPSSTAYNSAALAEPLLHSGTGAYHTLVFGVTGDCVVGVASAGAQAVRRPCGTLDPWTASACGVSIATGCLQRSAVSNRASGVLGKVVSPHKRGPGDSAERLVHLRISHSHGTLSIKVEHPNQPPADWVDAQVGLPPHVQPWVCVPARRGGLVPDDVAPEVRLVSCTAHRPPIAPALAGVRGLAHTVRDWPQAKQALALAWCQAEAVVDLEQVCFIYIYRERGESMHIDR